MKIKKIIVNVMNTCTIKNLIQSEAYILKKVIMLSGKKRNKKNVNIFLGKERDWNLGKWSETEDHSFRLREPWSLFLILYLSNNNSEGESMI